MCGEEEERRMKGKNEKKRRGENNGKGEENMKEGGNMWREKRENRKQ